jgi:hypothetical protein
MGSTGRTHGETAVTTPATKATISNRITIDVIAGARASGAGGSETTRRPRQPGRLHESRGPIIGSRAGAAQATVTRHPEGCGAILAGPVVLRSGFEGARIDRAGARMALRAA